VFPTGISDKTHMSTGLFGGTFQINNDKYIVLSNPKNSDYDKPQYFLISSLYKIQKNKIIGQLDAVDGYCKKDPSSLEEAIKRHVKTFNDNKLRELKNKSASEDNQGD